MSGKTSKKKTASNDLFASWKGVINWKKRVNAVCKPCWEIKYCPYGPLVEDFPLKEVSDSQSCRIFGHDCPVFHVAEPFTETKELRNLSRDIPRPTQFRVLKRENQICSVCSNVVRDHEIHFDHVIPFSKGGSSDESNIRLLCDRCNLKRSNRYEDEYLVTSAAEHLQKPLDSGFVKLLLDVLGYGHEVKTQSGNFPTPIDISTEFGGSEASLFDERLAQTLSDLQIFFNGKKPSEITKNQFLAMATRWGYINGKVHKLSAVATKYRERLEQLVLIERTLLSRVGWYIKDTKSELRKWERF